MPDLAKQDASLSSLTVTGGPLSPAFSAGTTMYTVQTPCLTPLVQVTATPVTTGSTLLIQGVEVDPGTASAPVTVGTAPAMISVVVKTPDGTQKSYDLVATCQPNDYLKASNTGGGDQFGYSISLSGDTLAVGAYMESSSATGVNGNQSDNGAGYSGAVYVFARTGTTWTQQAYLKASNTAFRDEFGCSVSLAGDTLAVGARGEDSSATGLDGNQTDNGTNYSGAVYIFTRSGTTWSQQAYLKASNTGPNDGFGQSVSLAGDTLAVGAFQESSSAPGVNGNQADNNAMFSGAVYVFTRSGTTWAQQAYLKASNTGASDQFGYSVSLAGDTLAVGAHGEDSDATGLNGNQSNNNAMSSGAVYVFARSGTTWSQQAYLKASNTGTGDQFGFSVSLAGDTLAVGAPGESSSSMGANGSQRDDSVPESGAVYLFTRTSTAWSQQTYLKASNTGPRDGFGWSVSLAGDLLAVGAYQEASSTNGVNGDQSNDDVARAGAAYVFKRAGSSWTQQSYLKGRSAQRDDQFGYSVSLSGDTLAVGVREDDSDATGINGTGSGNLAMDSGAVLLFR